MSFNNGPGLFTTWMSNIGRETMGAWLKQYVCQSSAKEWNFFYDCDHSLCDEIFPFGKLT